MTKRKQKTKRCRSVEWKPRDQCRAEREGWAIFDVYGALQEIERDDERKKFESDEAAMEHVYRQALAGSRLHVRAIVIHCRQAIDVFKAAHGYGEDDQLPEKAPEGRRYARYNHQFSIAYNVNSDDPTGEDVSAWDHRSALLARASELTRMDADEVRETVENMDNSYENPCMSPQGWPPEPEDCDDITTTG